MSGIKLSRTLFWDTNYETIDWKKNYRWVICRVLDRGSLHDWHALKKMYTQKQIIKAATEARYLSKKTVHWLHHIFNLPLTNFRCYNLMQLSREPWIY